MALGTLLQFPKNSALFWDLWIQALTWGKVQKMCCSETVCRLWNGFDIKTPLDFMHFGIDLLERRWMQNAFCPKKSDDMTLKNSLGYFISKLSIVISCLLSITNYLSKNYVCRDCTSTCLPKDTPAKRKLNLQSRIACCCFCRARS